MRSVLSLLVLLIFSASCLQAEALKVLFLGGGGKGPGTGHNGRINHLRLIPEFLRSGIEMTYSSDANDLNPQTLSEYEVVILYIGIQKDPRQAEWIANLDAFVENGGGLVAIHHTCGSFGESDDFISLIGGQFKSHGSGWFRAKHVRPDHPALGGVPEFKVWDESYVHKNLNDDRIDLQVRDEKGRDEPWTWVREQGRGRVFYTAHGHDGRSWENFDFQRMIAAGTIWVSGRDPRPCASDIPEFEYRDDVAGNLHNHEKRQGFLKIQEQLAPEDSAKCLVLEEGFEAQLVVHEPNISNPIDIVWDDRGRMFVAETNDYPYIKEKGSDRIVICEDGDGDGKMDKFTTFAEGFSLITGICWVDGGIILAQAPDMYFLKDTDGDDKADIIKKINSGWGTGDLHGGPSNLRYGFDNYIYGCVGGGGFWDKHLGRFSAGIWRMNIDGSGFTPIGNLGDNSWGLSLSEDFEIFASSANRGPAKHISVPYPYFDALGLKKTKALNIFDSHAYYPLTVTRQGDHFGSYTSASGFDLYTARSYPEEYWNQAAFVGGPTGKLLGQFFLKPDGKGSFTASNEGSFVASFDEYTAPIGGKVGPDGHVYMLDWNNLIMLHGGEIQNPLRDYKHGRIYRIVYKEGVPSQALDLSNADTEELVSTLKNDNLFWRMMAQQKMVQQKRIDVVPALIEMAKDRSIDGIGSSPAVIHALWTLHGLGQLDGSNMAALDAAHAALDHSSASVRKNAVRVLPPAKGSREVLAAMLGEADANTLRYLLLALSTMPADSTLGERLYGMKRENEGRPALDAPFNLALIKHGATLLDHLIAELPKRDHGSESEGKEEVELENLLKNASFEVLDKEGMPADRWIAKVHNGKARMSIDSTVARTGQNSARVDSTEGGGAEYLMISNLEPGEYIMSAWVKTRDVNGGNGVLLRADGNGLDEHRSRAVKGTIDDWEQLQMNFRVKEDGGVLLFFLFGAWAPTTGTVWFDDVALYQLSSERVASSKPAAVETLLAKQAFSEGADSIIRLTKLVSARSEKSTKIFMEGLTDLSHISFTEAQLQKLRALAEDAAPANKMHLAIFASNNKIDIGLSELANSIQGFEADILEGDAARGKELTAACVVCHAEDFNGLTSERSPSLPQLSDWYLQTQMQKFKHNVRGNDVSDTDGFLMKTLMSQYSHQQIADMAAYIRTQASKPSKVSLDGDPVKGEILYSNCVACHLADGTGSEELKSPSLLGLSDVYIVNQLRKFKDGRRGSGKGDKEGKMMQMSTQALKDEQAMRDVAAYILKLKE